MNKDNVIEMANKLHEEELAKLNDLSFKKYVIRMSGAGRYYTWDSKMFKTKFDLEKHFKENQIDSKKVKCVDDWGGKYCWHIFFKVVKKNNLLFVLPFYVEGGVKTELKFNIYNWHTVLIIDKNGDIITYYGHTQRRYESETKINKVYRRNIPFYFDDLDYIGEFNSGESRYNYNRAISEQTRKLFVNFFGDNINENAKKQILQANTSNNFWEQVIKAFKRPTRPKNMDASIQLNLIEMKEDISSFAKNCMTIRYDNFIIHYTSYRTQFYDINTDKKYAINNYDNSLLGQSFKFEQGYVYYDEYSDRKAMMKYKNIFSNISDVYDKHGNPITASECFVGCYIENVLSRFRDKIVIERPSMGSATIGELDKNGVIPTFIVRGLFSTNAVRQRLDLMINSNLFYAYKSACSIDPGSYYRTEKFETAFKNKGKSMSAILELPNNKIRKIEEAASKLIYKDNRIFGFANIYNYLNYFSFVDLKSINDKQFDMIIDGMQNIQICYNFDAYIADIYHNMNKPLNTFLDVIFKHELFKDYSLLEKYKDYLNMRSGLKTQCDQFDENRWPILPNKNTRVVVTLRSEFVDYGYTTRWISAKERFRELKKDYCDIEILNQSSDRIVVGITMNQKEAIKYLHDEITPIFNLYKSKVELSKFVDATKRVEPFIYENNDFAIVIPQKPDDLAKEGSVLHHCVNSFTSAIIRGSENIVFLRRKTCIDVPFFTIALDNNKHIEQIHCYCNGNTTIDDQNRAFMSSGLESYKDPIDIIPFLTKWCKEKKISGLQTTYGALCAH